MSRRVALLLLLAFGCEGEPDRGLLVHHVANGDTLGGIAAEYHVPLSALAELNHLRPPYPVRLDGGVLVPANAPWTDALPDWRPPRHFEGALRPCAVTRWSAPSRRDDCACATGADARACFCAEDGFTLERPGRAPVRWPADLWMGEPDLWDARAADLDGDDRPEQVVAWLTAVSNGIGVTYWTVAIFGPDADAPTVFDVEEYGEGSLLAADRGCTLLATAWDDLTDPLRGWGLYFTGRRYRWAGGALVPTAEPVLARRLLDSFERRESADRPVLADVAGMLADPRTELRAAEPRLDDATLRSARAGRVVAASVDPPEADGDAPRLALTVAWSDGTSARLHPSPPLDDESLGPIALAEGTALLPDGYRPADPASLVGRPVRLATYVVDDEPRSVLRFPSTSTP
jgi:hypothetical protein